MPHFRLFALLQDVVEDLVNGFAISDYARWAPCAPHCLQQSTYIGPVASGRLAIESSPRVLVRVFVNEEAPTSVCKVVGVG